MKRFTYVIQDPLGIHARPTGAAGDLFFAERGANT